MQSLRAVTPKHSTETERRRTVGAGTARGPVHINPGFFDPSGAGGKVRR
jgi:hypothetical protein